jgi:hypothetical protein
LEVDDNRLDRPINVEHDRKLLVKTFVHLDKLALAVEGKTESVWGD